MFLSINYESVGLLAMPNDTNCSLGIQWVWVHFGECVTTQEHFAAFIMGFISLLLWLLPLFPQIYENYKRGNCDDSLSIYFLCFWFAGDSTNFVGAILTNQLPTQIYIGAYYLVQDTVLLSQYLYYKYKNNRWRAVLLSDFGPINRQSSEVSTRNHGAEVNRQRRRSGSPPPTVPTGVRLACVALCGLTGYSLLAARQFEHSASEIALVPWYALTSRVGRNSDPYSLTSTADASTGQRRLLRHFFNSATDELGYVLGSISAVCYLAGRIPQIIKNINRGDTEGLSLAMFVIIVAGNLTYGMSILMAGEGSEYILRHLPWLVGSIGCCSCDAVVMSQILYYDAKRRRLGQACLVDINQPLLDSDDDHTD